MKILSVHRKLSVIERCPYREVRLYIIAKLLKLPIMYTHTLLAITTPKGGS